MVIAARQQRCARRRADRRGVEGVVGDAFIAQFGQRRGVDRTAEGIGHAEADIVHQHDQDVRGAWREDGWAQRAGHASTP